MEQIMTSKEALDNLVHCKSITKCKECKHKIRCTMERDYDIVKEALERLEQLEKENQELKEKSVKAVGFVKLLIDNISNEKLNDDRCSITNIKTGEEYGNLKEYITKMFNIIWDIEIKWLD